MKLKRMNKSDRREQIIRSAVLAAVDVGYNAINQKLVAERAEVTACTVRWYFPDFEVLRDEVMRRAVSRCIPQILAVGIAIRDPRALAVDRKRIVEFIGRA